MRRPLGSPVRALVRESASAAFAPGPARPPACRPWAAQSWPFYRFRSGRNRERPGHALRGGSLVPGSEWGWYSRRRRLPEEPQAKGRVRKNPLRRCSLIVTIAAFLPSHQIGFDERNVKLFRRVRYAVATRQMPYRSTTVAIQRRRYCGRGVIAGAARSSLWRKLIRPLVRSYGVISTVTRSPASIRIRFFFILPEE